MLNKKLLIILVIVVVISLVVVGVLIFLSQKQTVVDINNINSVVNNNIEQTLPQSMSGEAVNKPMENVNTNEKIVNTKEQAKTDAINIAKFFVEMIGSYSPSARFQNVIDAQPMMTKDMFNWSEDFMKRNLVDLDNNQESITTKVFKVEILSFDDTQTKIVLTTRRSKIASNEETNYSQDVEVEMVKAGGVWKVNKLLWK